MLISGEMGSCVGVVGGAGEGFLEDEEAVAPVLLANSPCRPHRAAELLQGRGGAPGKVAGGVGGWLRAWGPGAALAGAGGGGGVSVVSEAGRAVPFLGGGGCGRGAEGACVPASGVAGVTGVGPWEVMAFPGGPGAARVDACMYTHTQTHIHNTYICLYMCVYIYIYIYIHIYHCLPPGYTRSRSRPSNAPPLTR